MPFLKDSSYREMLPSSEIPNEDYHQFLSLEKLIAKISKHQHSVFCCRSIGVLSSQGLVYTFHDLDDASAEIRVSLRYMKTRLPLAGRPFTAQLFGFVHWHAAIGPVLYATIIKDLQPPLARKLFSTMEWVIGNHRMLNPDRPTNNKKRPPEATVTAANEPASLPHGYLSYQTEDTVHITGNYPSEGHMTHQIEAVGPTMEQMEAEPLALAALNHIDANYSYWQVETEPVWVIRQMGDQTQAATQWFTPTYQLWATSNGTVDQIEEGYQLEIVELIALDQTVPTGHVSFDQDYQMGATAQMGPNVRARNWEVPPPPPTTVPGVCARCNHDFDVLTEQNSEQRTAAHEPSDPMVHSVPHFMDESNQDTFVDRPPYMRIENRNIVHLDRFDTASQQRSQAPFYFDPINQSLKMAYLDTEQTHTAENSVVHSCSSHAFDAYGARPVETYRPAQKTYDPIEQILRAACALEQMSLSRCFNHYYDASDATGHPDQTYYNESPSRTAFATDVQQVTPETNSARFLKRRSDMCPEPHVATPKRMRGVATALRDE